MAQVPECDKITEHLSDIVTGRRHVAVPIVRYFTSRKWHMRYARPTRFEEAAGAAAVLREPARRQPRDPFDPPMEDSLSIRTHLTLAAAVLLVLAAGAAPVLADGPIHTGPAIYTGPAVKTITAALVDGTGASVGTVTLNQDAEGVVQVNIDAAGLPAGAHGVHIHGTGKCDGPAFTSAGGHFNPGGSKHGLDSVEGPHAGDLPAIPASFTGIGIYTVATNRVSLTAGASSIDTVAGAALVVHAADDDQVSDPSGNSGARIACAVLVASTATPTPAPTATAAPTPKPPATGSGIDAGATGSRDAAFVAIAGAVLAAAAGFMVTRRR